MAAYLRSDIAGDRKSDLDFKQIEGINIEVNLDGKNGFYVLCFVVRYFMSILVLQSSWWGRESWLLYLICLPGVS